MRQRCAPRVYDALTYINARARAAPVNARRGRSGCMWLAFAFSAPVLWAASTHIDKCSLS